MTTPGSPSHFKPSPTEQLAIDVAREAGSRCICGGDCENEGIPLTHALAGRLRRYRAEHPEHEFVYDDEGNVGVILGWNQEYPEVRAAPDLETLLDELDAAPVADLS